MSPGAVLNASGYVTARRRATVSSKVTGKVLGVFVEEGQAVRGARSWRASTTRSRAPALAYRRGAARAARTAAAEDQARLREAELTLTRRQQLLKDGVVGHGRARSARGRQ